MVNPDFLDCIGEGGKCGKPVIIRTEMFERRGKGRKGGKGIARKNKKGEVGERLKIGEGCELVAL